jgi:adenylosuccinate lyase
MLDRYTRPEMLELWARPETKFEYWLKVECAWNDARAERGEISWAAANAIRKHAKINVLRMKEIEAKVQHDMIAFVIAVQESLDDAGVGQYTELFHERLTSYNVEDPAMVLMLRKALEYILLEMTKLLAALRKRAKEFKYCYMIMRTHGQFAEPSTFGHLLLVFADAVRRSIRRLEMVYHHELIEANISGAVGSYGEINPALEQHTATLLGLKPALAETQILQRDRHASLMTTIAIAGSTIEQMCRTFWEMMRSDVRELQEPFGKGQKGSSAMAHKKNPISTEQGQGIPRLLRSNAQAAMENIATPEGRDISQSSVERHIFPDATSQLHYLAIRATNLVEGLVVFPDRMKENLEVGTQGTWAGQRVRTALMRSGVDYHAAYGYIQNMSFKALDEKRSLHVLVSKYLLPSYNQTAQQILGQAELAELFDYKSYVRSGIEHIFVANDLA